MAVVDRQSVGTILGWSDHRSEWLSFKQSSFEWPSFEWQSAERPLAGAASGGAVIG